jgi:hypothetical protein
MMGTWAIIQKCMGAAYCHRHTDINMLTHGYLVVFLNRRVKWQITFNDLCKQYSTNENSFWDTNSGPISHNFMENKELHTRAQHGPNPKTNKFSQHLTSYLFKINTNTDILFHPHSSSYLLLSRVTNQNFSYLIFPTYAAIPALTIFQYLTTLIIFSE